MISASDGGSFLKFAAAGAESCVVLISKGDPRDRTLYEIDLNLNK